MTIVVVGEDLEERIFERDRRCRGDPADRAPPPIHAQYITVICIGTTFIP